MILSDRDIRALVRAGKLKVEPFEPNNVSPASLDVRLGNKFRVFKLSDHSVIDPKTYEDKMKGEVVFESGIKMVRHEYTDLYEGFGPLKPFVIHPHDFVLGSTLEVVGLPSDIGAKLEGRSSLGRLGLVVHSTAGWIDPGFKGHITLEITNVGKIPVKIYPGMRIGQLVFEQMTSPAEVPYDQRSQSKYMQQKEATESKIHLDAEFRP